MYPPPLRWQEIFQSSWKTRKWLSLFQWFGEFQAITQNDCYFCMVPPTSAGMTRKEKWSIAYPNIPSAIRPVLHDKGIPFRIHGKNFSLIQTMKRKRIDFGFSAAFGATHSHPRWTDRSWSWPGPIQSQLRQSHLDEDLKEWNCLQENAWVKSFRKLLVMGSF